MSGQIIRYGIDNIYGIENPDQCICRVQLYIPSHRTLLVTIIHEDRENSYLSFGGVEYFEGTMGWVGANFKTASLEETEVFFKSLNMTRHRDNDLLYIIDSPKTQIKIIAPLAFYTPKPQKFYGATYIQDNQLLERITLQRGKPQILKSEWRNINGHSKEMRYGTYVEQILERFEAGDKHEDILNMFPWLDAEDIQAALVYARRAISKPSDAE
jgi:hypothetical protein